MTFTEKEKSKALAIVSIFETSRPFGEYAACTVSNDGAGVSYGINQFTHRSGSLAAVVEAYLNNGGKIGTEMLGAALPVLKRNSAWAIDALASDERFKRALRSAAVTREMKYAQWQVAFERYLRPALEICAERRFVLPLSLAVIYDSMNQGSWERISRNAGSLLSDEKAWVLEYVRRRHFWLLRSTRLRPTSCRTKFFLEQIAIGNWNLSLPLTVHGLRLTEEMLPMSEPGAVATGSIQDDPEKSILTSAGEAISSAAEKFDRVDNIVTTVTSRTDAAKSLWTTVIGTAWQMLWAVFGFFAGLPRAVWIVVAVIGAVLMILYLHRQIELGRIREKKQLTADSY